VYLIASTNDIHVVSIIASTFQMSLLEYLILLCTSLLVVLMMFLLLTRGP